jgi:hypothetical protein
MDRVRNRFACAVPAAIFAAQALFLAVPADAAQDDAGAPPPGKEERFEDRLVPIPFWSKDVADNGCRLHAAPIAFSKDALTSPTEIPFWTLIEHTVGRYSVRDILDPPEKFLRSLEPLDPGLRTLALLHSLHNGLGADGLHTYFYLKGGQNAPAVRDALQSAGFAREHALFAEAMALFGDTYPVDSDARARRFGYATSTQELNDFDRGLLALSKRFGSREAWTGIIVGYVNRTPALWKRIEAVRGTLGEMRRFEHLTQSLLAPIDFWKPYTDVQRKLAALTKEQRTLLVLAAFNSEFENGGVHQVFYNAEGSIAPEVQEALAGIGLARQAELVARAIAMFKAPYPRDTEKRRETHFHDHDGWNDWDRQLSELTDAFYALDGGPQVLHIGGDTQIQGGPGLRHAMLAFAKHHDMLPC